MGVTQAQILAINKNGSGTIDFQKEALSKQGSYPLDAGESKHNLLQKRLSLKATGMKDVLKDSDDLYKSILKLKKTGMLKDMLKRAGIKKSMLNESVFSIIDPNTSAKNVQVFQEMEGAAVSIGGSPIVPMGGFGTMVKDSYPSNGGLGTTKKKSSKDKEEIIEEFNLGNKIFIASRDENPGYAKKIDGFRKQEHQRKILAKEKKELALAAKKINYQKKRKG